jgi:hypothetical protein
MRLPILEHQQDVFILFHSVASVPDIFIPHPYVVPIAAINSYFNQCSSVLTPCSLWTSSGAGGSAIFIN